MLDSVLQVKVENVSSVSVVHPMTFYRDYLNT